MINYVVIGENSFDTFRSIFPLFNFRLISRSEKNRIFYQEQRSMKQFIYTFLKYISVWINYKERIDWQIELPPLTSSRNVKCKAEQNRSRKLDSAQKEKVEWSKVKTRRRQTRDTRRTAQLRRARSLSRFSTLMGRQNSAFPGGRGGRQSTEYYTG